MAYIKKELDEKQVLDLLENDPLINFAKRKREELDSKKTTHKKYEKPEAKFVEQLMTHLKNRGFFINKYESKFIKKQHKNGISWQSSGVRKGHPDTLGCDDKGHILAIEVKAPGKRSSSTIRPDQVAFLTRIINNNGFGVCVDSIELFDEFYDTWIKLPINERSNYLLKCLP